MARKTQKPRKRESANSGKEPKAARQRKLPLRNLFETGVLSSRWRHALLYLGAVLVVIYFLGIIPRFGYLWYYIDGYSIERRAVAAAVRYILWEEPDLLPGSLNEITGNRDACISADGQTLILTRYFSNNNADLFLSRRAEDGSWARPIALHHFNTTYDEIEPELSKDGQYLYFSSNRPGGKGGYDLYVSIQEDGGWSQPVNLGDAVNSLYDEHNPALSRYNDILYFTSNRPHSGDAGYGATRFSASASGNNTAASKGATGNTKSSAVPPPAEDMDIFRAYVRQDTPGIPDGPSQPGLDKDAGGWSPERPPDWLPEFDYLERVAALNSDADEGKCALTPRGDKVYFASNRKGGYGGFDLYESRMVNGRYIVPENLSTPINSAFDEMNPSLAMEGFQLVYSSNEKERSRLDYYFYESFSREVIPRVDWALLRSLVLIVLLAAAAVALTYYLLYLLLNRHASMRLLTRCLLASLLIHLILLAWSASWILSSKVNREYLDQPAEMTINVTNLARESIALAVRESVAALPAVEKTATASPPSEPITAPETTPEEVTSEPVSEMAVSEKQMTVAPEDVVAIRDATSQVQSVDPVAMVQPLSLGVSSITMEMPTGVTQQGTQQGDVLSTKLPKPEPRKRELNVTETVAELEKETTPMEFRPMPASDSTVAARVQGVFKENRNQQWEKAVQTSAVMGGVALDTPTNLLAMQGSAPTSRTIDSSVGMLMLPGISKLETGTATPDTAVSAELGILLEDRVRARRLFMQYDRLQRQRILQEILDISNQVNAEMPYETFGLVEFYNELRSLDRVGNIIAADMPALQMPADSELEVPEAWLDEEPPLE